MKRFTQKIKPFYAWLGMVVLALVLVLYVPQPGNAQSSTSLNLRVGTDADYIPFEYRDTPSSDIVGFDIDIAKYIAAQLDFTFDIHEVPFEQLLPELQAGELDFAIAAITPTPSRRVNVDFSIPYFEARHALISQRTHPVRTSADLSAKRIAVQQGSFQEQTLITEVESGAEFTILPLERMNDVVSAVRDGDADVAIAEELVAEAYLENNPTLVMDVMGEWDSTPMAIAFPSDSPYVEPFNQVLTEMKNSGELYLLAKQWFTADP